MMGRFCWTLVLILSISSLCFGEGAKDLNRFSTTVDRLPNTPWYGPSDKELVNKLITHPCFSFSMPYKMPTKTGECGFVCSAHAAVLATHFRSLGIQAMPYYLEWQNEKKETEAHAMVVVPFQNDRGERCHHVIEGARTWPKQPIVEFQCCHPGKYREGDDTSKSLFSCFSEHFGKNHKGEDGFPIRTARALTSGRTIDKAYCTKDAFNPPTPIWCLNEKGDATCSRDLCKTFQITPTIQIHQEGVDPGRADTFNKTTIEVDESKSQEFRCTRMCPRQNCTFSDGTERPFAKDWEIRATCRLAAGYRTYLRHSEEVERFTCQNMCRDAGGTYSTRVLEPNLACAEQGAILHETRQADGHASDKELFRRPRVR